MARVNKQVLVILGGLMGLVLLLKSIKNTMYIWILSDPVGGSLDSLGRSMGDIDLVGNYHPSKS